MVPYFLHAVVVHSGTTSYGHYHICIRNYETDNKWWRFSDSIVTLVTWERIEKSLKSGNYYNNTASNLVYINEKLYKELSGKSKDMKELWRMAKLDLNDYEYEEVEAKGEEENAEEKEEEKVAEPE